MSKTETEKLAVSSLPQRVNSSCSASIVPEVSGHLGPFVAIETRKSIWDRVEFWVVGACFSSYSFFLSLCPLAPCIRSKSAMFVTRPRSVKIIYSTRMTKYGTQECCYGEKLRRNDKSLIRTSVGRIRLFISPYHPLFNTTCGTKHNTA
jgi:hypothetical protein